MRKTHQIYVSLQNEGVQVWRPIQAMRLHENIYRILDQPYDRETESWEFGPGDDVVCQMIESSDGPILAATRKNDR